MVESSGGFYHRTKGCEGLRARDMDERVYDRKKMMLGDLGILTCAMLWGVSFAATKEVLKYMGPLWLLAFRFAFSFMLIAAITPKRVRNTGKRDLKVGGIIGFLLLVAMALQTIGIQYTTTGKSAFITACYVVMVPFITWAASRRNPGLKAFVASAICLVGMGAITLDGTGMGFGLGEMLTLGCALAFAVQIVVIDRMAQDRDALTLTMIETALSAVACVVAALIWEPLPSFGSPAVVGWMAYLVVGCTLIPYSLQIKSQQLTSPTHASVIMIMESVFALVVGIAFLGEPMTSRLVWGCGLIFLSIMITELDVAGFARMKRQEA